MTATALLETLLYLAAKETDDDCRLALAKCLGEVGAIDESRLGRFHFSKGKTPESSHTWMLSQAPWHSTVARYEFVLLSSHLVRSLHAATVSIDQHKIAFCIQEVLRHLDSTGRSGNGSKSSLPNERNQDRMRTVESTMDEKNTDRDKDRDDKKGDPENCVDTDENVANRPKKERGEMSDWLKKKLVSAKVFKTIETYWYSKFNEVSTTSEFRQPHREVLFCCRCCWKAVLPTAAAAADDDDDDDENISAILSFFPMPSRSHQRC